MEQSYRNIPDQQTRIPAPATMDHADVLHADFASERGGQVKSNVGGVIRIVVAGCFPEESAL
jgi:hypothetical protein